MNNVDTYSLFYNEKDETIDINLSGNKRILPVEYMTSIIDANNVYESERSKSNIFRLIVSINPFCSNILFNPFTEIVYKEGSNESFCLNFENLTTENLPNSGEVIGKSSMFVWNEFDAVRDTQLSSSIHNMDYNCGIDIFNNHLLRSKTFKSVNYSTLSLSGVCSLTQFYGYGYRDTTAIEVCGDKHVYFGDDFNTIDDYLRDKFGVIVSEEVPIGNTSNIIFRNNYRVMPLHLYQEDDIYSFNDCLKDRKLNNNGWYGFKNRSSFSYTVFNSGNTISSTTSDINKVINYRGNCEFIDLYPGRDLYSFKPKYNSYRKRLEKNWNYCLTYPSENVLKQNEYTDFPFFEIIDGKAALKALMYDELTINDSGQKVLTIYSVSQHGLINGDRVNIYLCHKTENGKSGELVYKSSEVTVIDKYTFHVMKTERNMSSEWIEVDKIPYNFIKTYNRIDYKVCASKRCNVDNNAQDVCFRRVVDDVECEYYVRKFSRIPNFKFKAEEINDYYLYDTDYNNGRERTLIEEYSDPTNVKSEFESHISKLGFSNNAYGDDNVEIVFTDDVDVSYLKDNLGRPLSEIYLTIVKNNKGYKKWYGYNGGDIVVGDESVEYSHCFGKNNCGFLLSDYYRAMNGDYDVRNINSVGKSGLIMRGWVDDEIDFYSESTFYGDICCFSPIDCNEESIQKVMNRFNTVQREIGLIDCRASGYFETFVVDEIKDTESNLRYRALNESPDAFNDGYKMFNELADDDYSKRTHSVKVEYENLTKQTEGYYYQPHYRIQIKKVSDELKSSNGVKYDLYSVTQEEGNVGDKAIFQFRTYTNNSFSINDKLTLYKKSSNEYFFVTILSLITDNRFRCDISNEKGEYIINSQEGFINKNNIGDFVLLKKHDDTPEYARLIKDGSCRYYWRDIVANGVEDDPVVYPFTNGAFYINKQINFFLRRQDPAEEFLYKDFKSKKYEYIIPEKGNFVSHNVHEYDTYFKAGEIKEC